VEVLKISVLNEMIGDDEDRTEQKDKWSSTDDAYGGLNIMSRYYTAAITNEIVSPGK
jgi:hypothetical protein